MHRPAQDEIIRKKFVICFRNNGYEVSLEPRKLYQILPDPDAAKHQQLRVIDESGEDYLYPKSYFVPIELRDGRRALSPMDNLRGMNCV